MELNIETFALILKGFALITAGITGHTMAIALKRKNFIVVAFFIIMLIIIFKMYNAI